MRRRTHKWINGTKGMISLLLAMLLLPFYSLAAVLIESLRYQSAVKALDGLLGSAGISTLADYDTYLQERFGLLAVSQKGGEDHLTDTLISYLNKNKLTDAAGIDLDSVSADGMYPLADTTVLRRQIEEYGKVLVPAKVVTDGLHIEDIIKELEKATNLGGVFSTIAGGTNVVNTEADALLASSEATDTARVVERNAKAYDEKFNAWSAAVQELSDHLATACPSEEEDEQGYETWTAAKDELTKAADKAKGAYETAISTLTKSLDSLQSKIDEVVLACEKFKAESANFIVQTGSASYQGSHAGDNTYQDADKVSSAIAGAVKSGTGNYSSRVNQTLGAFDSERLLAAARQLGADKAAVKAYKTDAVTAEASAPEDAKYHTAQVAGLVDADALNQILSDSQKEIKETGLIDTISSLISGFNSLFKLQTFFDPALNCKLDEEYYQLNYGGLPSGKNRGSGPFALPSGQAADEQRSLAYLQEIDPDFDPLNPYGVRHSFDTSIIVQIIQDLKRLANAVDTLTGTINPVEWFKALANACSAAGNMAAHSIQFVGQLTNRIKEIAIGGAYDRLVLNGYLAYNLPNRTNYITGSSLTGYSFSKIPYGQVPADVTYQLPTGFSRLSAMVSAITSGGGHPAKSLAGAELEYVMWGFNSELGNQFMQFLALFVFRFVVDVQILFNAEVLSVIAASTIASPIVTVLYVALEALADTIVLVNGGDVTLLKTTPYTTAGGIVSLVQELTTLPVNAKPTSGNGGVSGSNGSAGTGNTGTISLEKPPASGGTPSGGQAGNSFHIGSIDFLAFNYMEHSLVLMQIFGNEQDYLNRLTDLIQSESSAYREQNISLSNRANGTPEAFDIDKSYTVIRAAASGSLKPLLPIPVLSGKGPLATERVIYRGY